MSSMASAMPAGRTRERWKEQGAAEELRWGASGVEENGDYRASTRLASCSARNVNFLSGVLSLSSVERLTVSQDLCGPK